MNLTLKRLAQLAKRVFKPCHHGARFTNYWNVRCIRNGKVIWEDNYKNLITNVGLNDILDGYYGNGAPANIYIGLTDDTPAVAAADTMASHVGWVEATGYTESVRQTLTIGTAAGQSVDNSASVASFSMNTADTIGGAFLTTVNTKGDTTGILIAVGAFSGGDRAVVNTDVIEVTVTLTAADDGV